MGTIIVNEVNRKPKAQAHVVERIGQGLCVGCDETEHKPKPYRRRGLCTTCEGRWFRSLQGKTKQQVEDINHALMERGLLLEEDEIRQLTRPNPFATVANEVVR